MPPEAADRLSPAQVADFEEWIRQGAPDPRSEPAARAADKAEMDLVKARQFWSFRPVVDSPPPRVDGEDASDTAIDRFVRARLHEKGLRSAPLAEKAALLRRATFDLVGLPPTPDEIRAFMADQSPNAFAKVVDRLLASPHYGERWGRHWLDLVRYADTAGDSSDFPVPSAYQYRNYVFRSFGEDKPYDQFLREQIAGDLLPTAIEKERYQRIIATGYLATARRFGTLLVDYNQHLIIEDTIDNLGKTVLGLSLGCARCHDHKFDPVSHADYYALYGIFESTRYPFPGLEEIPVPRDFVPLAPARQVRALLGPREKTLAPLRAEHDRLQGEKDAIIRDGADAKAKGDTATETALAERLVRVSSAYDKARRKLFDAERKPLPIDFAYAVAEANQRGNARIQLRGDPKVPGPEVPRRFLQVLGGQSLNPKDTSSGRLALAGWLTDPSNPLTARVMVNRIWQHHFGRGLVGTPSDFGLRGTPPSHPELLDWLAARFVEGGWSMKNMHRLIMLSRAYQRSSREVADSAAIDPKNEYLWRFNRQRLEAEIIRDTILAVTGTLDLVVGGPHPFPPVEKWRFSQHEPFAAVYDHRLRSAYLMTQRARRHPYLTLFDGADTSATTAERTASTTPLQALFMLNAEFVDQNAAALAERLLTEGKHHTARIERAYLLLFGRSPTAEERTAALAYLTKVSSKLASAGLAPPEEERKSWSAYARILLGLNELIYVD
jgi:hypothetical protein